MSVFVRPDSHVYWLRLDGYVDANGNRLREPTKIRIDASLPAQRKENRQLAEQRFHERMIELAKGAAAGGRPQITFADHLDWWIRHQLPSRRGRERETEILPRLRAAFGALDLRAIDPQRVREWMTTRLKTPTVTTLGQTRVRTYHAAASTVNREVGTLKAILQAAVPKYFTVSPLRGMSRLPTTTPKRRLMTEAEEAKLLAVMTPADRALFLLALDSLIRLHDVLDLTWADDHGPHVYVRDPKAGGGFNVPVSARARAALDAIRPPAAGRRKTPYIFARRRRAKTERDRRSGIREMLKRYCRLADVPYGRTKDGLTFHWATRRTGATRMLTRQVDLGTVQKVGHWRTAAVVLGIYHELLDDQAQAAVNSVGPASPPRARRVPRTRRTATKPV